MCIILKKNNLSVVQLMGYFFPEMDCFAILKIHSNTSGQDGVYTIHPNKATGRNVFCDMTTDGGGWTVSWNVCF